MLAAVTLACTLYCSRATALQLAAGKPDLSTVPSAERGMIEDACNLDRQVNGPAAYYACLRRHIAALQQAAGKPDLSSLALTSESATFLKTDHC
jgi:hypothetical protein